MEHRSCGLVVARESAAVRCYAHPTVRLEDAITFSLAHAHWGLRSLIDAARPLPPAALEQDLGIGPGGLRANLAHTIECVFFFAANLSGRHYEHPPEGFEARSATLDGLSSLLEQAQGELDAALRDYTARGCPDTVPWPNAPTGSLPAPAALAQIVDHAALHRTQAINILKRLGVSPLPDLDPMSFQATRTAAIETA